jgi:cytochrome c oxidase subunit 2
MRRIPLALTAILLLTSCGGLEAATSQGREIRGVWVVFLWAGAGVAAVVYGLIIWSVVRYRRRNHDDEELPPQFRQSVPLEILYTVVPLLLVIGLFVLTYRAETTVEGRDPQPAATLGVEAYDWSWRFTYQGTGVEVFGTPDDPPEAVLPVGETVRVRLTSADVIHSFFVPEFLFKRDAIPGRTTAFDLSIDEPGLYRGQCAEFCGLDHWRMRFTIRAVSPDEFERWLTEQGAPA